MRQDRQELVFALVGFFQRLFCVFSLRKIINNAYQAVELTRSVFDRKGPISDPADRPVRSYNSILLVGLFTPALFLQDGGSHTLLVFGVYGVHERPGILVEALARPAPDPLIGGADVE